MDQLILVLQSLPALRSTGLLRGVAEAVEALEQAGRVVPLQLEQLATWQLTQGQVAALTRLCPSLSHLEVRQPAERGVLPLLAGLSQLHSAHLEVRHADQLGKLLVAAGTRCERLVLLHWIEGPFPLHRVAALCPRLEVLTVLCQGNFVEYGDQPSWPAIKELTLKYLKYR